MLEISIYSTLSRIDVDVPTAASYRSRQAEFSETRGSPASAVVVEASTGETQ